MNEKIKRYIEANIDGCGCNLQCSYCYLRQANYEQKAKETCLKYSIDVIRKACSKERLEGACLFNLVGDGETLLPRETIDLVEALVLEEHYVSIVTNGTITTRIAELIERLEKINKESHVCFNMSLHYVELKKKGLLNAFWESVNYLKEKGISYFVKMVLGEETDYVLAEEIKAVCKEKMGVYPHVSLARKDNPDGTFSICTNLSQEEYYALGDGFQSQMFELDKQEFNCKREEFCYAGKWLFILNFSTGKCYECLANHSNEFDFFSNLEEELCLETVGNRCHREYCSCTNFQAWGIMPEHCEKTNLEIYDRTGAGWLKEPFKTIYKQKLYETNPIYSEEEKILSDERMAKKEMLNRKHALALKLIQSQEWHEAVLVIDELIRSDLFDLKKEWMKRLIVLFGYALLMCPEYEDSHLVYQEFYREMCENNEYLSLLKELLERNNAGSLR